MWRVCLFAQQGIQSTVSTYTERAFVAYAFDELIFKYTKALYFITRKQITSLKKWAKTVSV